jgi:hypothetical protein
MNHDSGFGLRGSCWGFRVRGSGISVRDSGIHESGLGDQCKGFGVQRKTRLHRCKAGFDCSWISYRVFVGFLLVLEGEAVELSASFKRHGDLVDSVALGPSPKVVSLLN